MAQAPILRDPAMVPPMPHGRPMTASPRMQHPQGQGGSFLQRSDTTAESVPEVNQFLVEQAQVMTREIAESTEKTIQAFVSSVHAAYSNAYSVVERRVEILQTENERLEGLLVNGSCLPHSTGGTGEMLHPPHTKSSSGMVTALIDENMASARNLALGVNSRPGSREGARLAIASNGCHDQLRPLADKRVQEPPVLQVSTPRETAPSLPGLVGSDTEDSMAVMEQPSRGRRTSFSSVTDAMFSYGGAFDMDGDGHPRPKIKRAIARNSFREYMLGDFPDGPDGDDSDYSGDERPGKQPKSVFADASMMKEKIRAAVNKKQYNVMDYYWETGVAQKIARSPWFENITLSIIFANAVWISIDTDYNDADLLLQAAFEFKVAENIFCCYFTFEWVTRFLAFEQKSRCLFDFWFVFDTIMCVIMVLETWVMTSVLFLSNSDTSEEASPAFDASVLKLFRLLRLSRVARMARLLRAVPELMILIKGMLVATRSVFFTLCLLIIIMYIFSIAICQLTKGTDTGEKYFPNVPASMFSLLMGGILPDQSPIVWFCVNDESTGPVNRALYALIMLLFILVGSLTVMNMLVGVLVEVVSVVSNVEKESLVVNFVKTQLLTLLTHSIDANGDKHISREEFHNILMNKKAAMVLEEVGVDVVGLVDFQDFIFRDTETLSFASFMEVILQLRGSNVATVRDIVDLRKFMTEELKRLEKEGETPRTSSNKKSAGSHYDFQGAAHLGLNGWPLALFANNGMGGGAGGHRASPFDLDADDGLPPRPVALNRPLRVSPVGKADVHKLLADFATNPHGTPGNPTWINGGSGLGMSTRWPSTDLEQFDDLDIEEVMAEHNMLPRPPTVEC